MTDGGRTDEREEAREGDAPAGSQPDDAFDLESLATPRKRPALRLADPSAVEPLHETPPLESIPAAIPVRTPTRAGAAQELGATLRPGQRLAGRYELIELLGEGGMGQVWKAQHTLLEGLRAIKVIHASISRDPDFRRRFLHEGQAMMRVRHPGVVEVTDLDETRDEGELFMAMEHLPGRSLYQASRDEASPLARDVRDVARILREVALGMQRVHDEGIVHRDLKSDNVILVRGDDGLEHPKVIDFGLAKRARDPGAAPSAEAAPAQGTDGDLRTTISGTLAYMAPEVFRGDPATFANDVYAFGVMAFECLTFGDYPLRRSSLTEYLETHRSGVNSPSLAAKRPELDRSLVRIVDSCKASAPGDRPASFADVARALERWLGAPERRRRARRLAAVSCAGALLAAAAIWGFFFSQTPSLGPVELSSREVRFPVRRDRRVYLPASALAVLRLTAGVEGAAGEPVLEVDGKRHPSRSEVREGILTATADLRGLRDGPHTLALRASATGAPSVVEIVVDRRAPTTTAVRVVGSADTWSNQAAPTLAVVLDEDAATIDGVALRIGGRTLPAEPDAQDAHAWTVVVAGAEDGPVDVEFRAKDLAGNEASSPFTFRRDTRRPRVDVAARVDDDRGAVVQVREAVGSRLAVSVDEAATVSVAFGDGAASDLRLESPGVLDVPMPPVPAEGLPVRLRVHDLAENEVEWSALVRAVEDVVSVRTPTGADAHAIRRDQPLRLVVARTYPLDGKRSLVATQELDERAERVPLGESVALESEVTRSDAAGRRHDVLVRPGALPPGVWRIGPTDVVGARVEPIRVVVDSDAATVESIEVADATGRVVAPGEIATTPEVVVTARVFDLSLLRIDLAGVAPAEAPAPGTREYRFRAAVHEGMNNWVLALVDAAGNAAEKTVAVDADLAAPALELLEPAATRYDDKQAVPFAGRCTEAQYTLCIEGLPAGASRTAFAERDFATALQLPASEALELVVSVEDRAGRRSPPRRLSLHVAHLATELPDELTWKRGVEVTVRKVEPGDVVFGGRAHGVGRVFLDRTEVTNGQYRAFLAAAAASGGHGAWCHADEPREWSHVPPAPPWAETYANLDALPVVNVAWWDAWAFAAWSGRRLPTEAEWVKAAAKSKSRDEVDLRTWPPFVGDEWRDGVLATKEATGGARPLPAAEGEDVSPAGCLHMGGNVSEWVVVTSGGAATRGGNWFHSSAAADIRRVPAKVFDPSFRAPTIGFRCAVDADAVQP